MNYKIFDSSNNEYNLTIADIIKKIKHYPNEKFYKENGDLINNELICKTQFICHRINKIEDLLEIDPIFGVEIDIRDNVDNLFLSHDPFSEGDNFEEYLKKYSHNTLILNIKSERTELKCLELLQKYNIENYFFLDSSFPMIYLLNTKYNENNIALRFSEYEPMPYKLDFYKWVWVDCFTYLPIEELKQYNLKIFGLKMCIVSPELQGQKEKISIYKKQLQEANIIPESICCKVYNIFEWI